MSDFPRRVNFLTLGTKDMPRAQQFFRDLFGWTPINPDPREVAFYDMGGWVLSLFGWDALASDAATAAEGAGFRGVAIAHNVPTRAEVDPFIRRAVSLGATLVKPAEDVFWGGHSGYFRDPDGHLWEIAWNPLMPTLADGRLKLS